MVLLLISSCNTNQKKEEFVNILEMDKTKLSFTVNGTIADMFCKEGDLVPQGIILAKVDTTDFHLEKIDLQTSVRENNIALQIASEKLQIALSERDHIKLNYDRTKSLFESESATKQSLDDITELLKKAEQNCKIGKLETEKLSTVARKIEISLQKVEKKIRDCEIRAPFTGRIEKIFFMKNEAVTAFHPVLELVNSEYLKVKIYLPISELTSIRVGDSMEIFASGIENFYSGKVSWISNTAEFTPKEILTPETRSSLVYAVIITVDNRNDELKDGMPVIIRTPKSE